MAWLRVVTLCDDMALFSRDWLCNGIARHRDAVQWMSIAWNIIADALCCKAPLWNSIEALRHGLARNGSAEALNGIALQRKRTDQPWISLGLN